MEGGVIYIYIIHVYVYIIYVYVYIYIYIYTDRAAGIIVHMYICTYNEQQV